MKILKKIIYLTSFLAAAISTNVSASEILNQVYLADDDSFYSTTIPEFHVVNEGIMRGGRPQPGDLEALKAQGIRTIINIDDVDPSQEKAEAIRLGLNFITSPMSSFSKPKDVQVNQILNLLQDKKLMPIFIHCKHGQDRTGMIMGLYRFRVDKWSSRKAYSEMKQYGFHSILFNLDTYFKKQTNYSKIYRYF